MMELTAQDKKTVVISGGGCGVGKAVAAMFVENGYEAVVIVRPERLNKTTNTDRITYYAADLSSPKQIKTSFKLISKSHRNICAIIANAAVLHYGDVADIKKKKIIEMVNTNIMGTVLFVKCWIKTLKKLGGNICLIGSADSMTPAPGRAVYASAKSFLMNFASSLHGEVCQYGINVCVINLSKTNTKMGRKKTRKNEADSLISPRDISQCVFYATNFKSETAFIQQINIFKKNKWNSSGEGRQNIGRPNP